MAAPIRVRQAQASDAEVLADLAYRTFNDTFAGDNISTDMEEYLQSSFTVDVIAHEIAHENNRFLLAYLENEMTLVGYSKLRVGATETCVSGTKPIELQRLYVDKSASSSGVGSRLMRESIKEAHEAGFETMWLGVWEKNLRAIQFYERWGFKAVGTHLFVLGADQQTDQIMEFALPVSSVG